MRGYEFTNSYLLVYLRICRILPSIIIQHVIAQWHLFIKPHENIFAKKEQGNNELLVLFGPFNVCYVTLNLVSIKIAFCSLSHFVNPGIHIYILGKIEIQRQRMPIFLESHLILYLYILPQDWYRCGFTIKNEDRIIMYVPRSVCANVPDHRCYHHVGPCKRIAITTGDCNTDTSSDI